MENLIKEIKCFSILDCETCKGFCGHGSTHAVVKKHKTLSKVRNRIKS